MQPDSGPTYKPGLDIGLRKQAGWKYMSVTSQTYLSAQPEMRLQVEFGSLWPEFSSFLTGRAHFCLSGISASGAAAELGL